MNKTRLTTFGYLLWRAENWAMNWFISLLAKLVWSTHLMWCIWRERNAQSFEMRKSLVLELKLSFFRALYEWMPDSGQYSFLNELLDLCNILSLLLLNLLHTYHVLGLCFFFALLMNHILIWKKKNHGRAEEQDCHTSRRKKNVEFGFVH